MQMELEVAYYLVPGRQGPTVLLLLYPAKKVSYFALAASWHSLARSSRLQQPLGLGPSGPQVCESRRLPSWMSSSHYIVLLGVCGIAAAFHSGRMPRSKRSLARLLPSEEIPPHAPCP